VKGLDGRLIKRPVRSLGLTIRPWVIRLGQPVLGAAVQAHHWDDHRSRDEVAWWVRRALINPLATSRVLWISTRGIE
jgi:hypothetical protein